MRSPLRILTILAKDENGVTVDGIFDFHFSVSCRRDVISISGCDVIFVSGLESWI